MSVRNLRVLYLPNERGVSKQRSFRLAFSKLEASSLVESVTVYGFLEESRTRGIEVASGEVVSIIKNFHPDVILMQHIGGSGLHRGHLMQWRAAGDFSLLYHEGDAYGRIRKPLPAEAAEAGRFSDICFTVGSGSFRRNFLRVGAKDVRWVPHVFDPSSFGVNSIRHGGQEVDLVMIGNRAESRYRFGAAPNARDRVKLVDLLTQRFGDRFAVYGSGWKGASARGPVSFSEQETVIQKAKVSINWDHYAFEPKYFSNRLPISLACGSVHLTTWHPGYDEIFGPETSDFLRLARRPSELVEEAESILNEVDATMLYERGHKARAWANANLRADNLLARMLAPVGLRATTAELEQAWKTEGVNKFL